MTTALSPRIPIAYRILDCFPSGSYALPGLLRLLDIVETDTVPSAAVECRVQPRLLINPGFVAEWASTSEKLLMLVMHELHHVLLGHTRLFPTVTPVDNLVFDAVINALLCRMFPGKEYTCLFSDFYSGENFPHCLLRPPDGWRPGGPVDVPAALRSPKRAALAAVYVQLYSDKGASYHDLYQALKEGVTERLAGAVPLIGDHRAEKDRSTDGLLDERSPVLFEAVRGIVEQWPQPPDPIAGRSLADLLRSEHLAVARPRSPRSVLRSLIRQVADPRLFRGSVRGVVTDTLSIATPIPVFDRRSVILNALGAPPLLYRQEIATRRVRPTGQRVHVYLDVSGSIGDLKGALYGAVLDCGEAVHPVVHLFSTKVADITLAELRRGVCVTTGGTHIGCVAEHINTSQIRRAVIITDGYVGKPGGSATDPATWRNIKAPDHVANVRTDTRAILGVVGRGYHVFQNQDSFDFMDSLVGDKLAMFETAGALKGGRKVWMLARIPKEYRAGRDDLIKPYVLLVNSFDGSTALRMVPATVRVVCQNTLNLALRQAGSDGIAIRHRPSLEDRVKEAREKLGVIAARFDRFDEELHAMLDAELTGAQVNRYFREVVPTPGAEASEREKANHAETMTLLHTNFEDDTNTLPGVRGTVWAAYNAVSEWADHQRSFRGKSDHARAESRLDSIWFGSSHRIKQQAYRSALALAAAN